MPPTSATFPEGPGPAFTSPRPRGPPLRPSSIESPEANGARTPGGIFDPAGPAAPTPFGQGRYGGPPRRRAADGSDRTLSIRHHSPRFSHIGPVGRAAPDREGGRSRHDPRPCPRPARKGQGRARGSRMSGRGNGGRLSTDLPVAPVAADGCSTSLVRSTTVAVREPADGRDRSAAGREHERHAALATSPPGRGRPGGIPPRHRHHDPGDVVCRRAVDHDPGPPPPGPARSRLGEITDPVFPGVSGRRGEVGLHPAAARSKSAIVS